MSYIYPELLIRLVNFMCIKFYFHEGFVKTLSFPYFHKGFSSKPDNCCPLQDELNPALWIQHIIWNF